MAERIYAKATPALVEALEAAPELGLVTERASRAERLETLAVAGYQAALLHQRQLAKLEAYQLLASDQERFEEVRRRAEAALKAGRI
jgi:hypothetical protein